MEAESFRSRVVALIQKSRRALRLYAFSTGPAIARVEGASPELSAAQIAEWREVNGLLLKKLTQAAESASTKKMVHDVFALRNEFQTLWRVTESEMVVQQRELVAAAERGDFIRASSLAHTLVSFKARVQAGQAAHHELDILIKRSRVVKPTTEITEESATVLSTIELLDEQSVVESAKQAIKMHLEPKRAAAGGGKVIPLKRRD
jgi:hypothetical protein